MDNMSRNEDAAQALSFFFFISTDFRAEHWLPTCPHAHFLAV